MVSEDERQRDEKARPLIKAALEGCTTDDLHRVNLFMNRVKRHMQDQAISVGSDVASIKRTSWATFSGAAFLAEETEDWLMCGLISSLLGRSRDTQLSDILILEGDFIDPGPKGVGFQIDTAKAEVFGSAMATSIMGHPTTLDEALAAAMATDGDGMGTAFMIEGTGDPAEDARLIAEQLSLHMGHTKKPTLN